MNPIPFKEWQDALEMHLSSVRERMYLIKLQEGRSYEDLSRTFGSVEYIRAVVEEAKRKMQEADPDFYARWQEHGVMPKPEVPVPVLTAESSPKEWNDALGLYLSYREREILKLRAGLGDGHSYTREDVAQIFKVTMQRIRQIEAKAMLKLRESAPELHKLLLEKMTGPSS